MSLDPGQIPVHSWKARRTILHVRPRSLVRSELAPRRALVARMRRFRVRRTAFHAQDTCEAFHVRSVAGVLLIDRPDVTLDPNPRQFGPGKAEMHGASHVKQHGPCRQCLRCGSEVSGRCASVLLTFGLEVNTVHLQELHRGLRRAERVCWHEACMRHA